MLYSAQTVSDKRPFSAAGGGGRPTAPTPPPATGLLIMCMYLLYVYVLSHIIKHYVMSCYVQIKQVDAVYSVSCGSRQDTNCTTLQIHDEDQRSVNKILLVT